MGEDAGSQKACALQRHLIDGWIAGILTSGGPGRRRDQGIRDLFGLLLPGEGYLEVLAVDGREALRVARRERPDVLLVDIVMPHLDGIGLCRSYRAEGGTSPIILMSASRPWPDSSVVEACGAVAYVRKPFDINHVLEMIGRLVDCADIPESSHQSQSDPPDAPVPARGSAC